MTQLAVAAKRLAEDMIMWRIVAVLLPVTLTALVGGCIDQLPTDVARRPIAPLAADVQSLQFVQVSAGDNGACALRNDGVVECWGPNGSGDSPPVRAASTGSFSQVSKGNSHTCALRTDGVGECWGFLFNSPAIQTASTGTFIQASAGFNGSFGVMCWLRNDGVVQCWGATVIGLHTAAVGSFTQVSGSNNEHCGVRTDGVIECWGGWYFCGFELCGFSAATSSFTQVSMGLSQFFCGLRADGVVQCWGNPAGGASSAFPAVRAATSGAFVQVSAGGAHTCALRGDGIVECWGNDSFGQAPATRAATQGSFTQVSSGGTYTCALRTDGNIECWGNNDQGRAPALRLPTPPPSTFGGFLAPVQPPPTVNVAKAGGAIPIKFSLGGGRRA